MIKKIMLIIAAAMLLTIAAHAETEYSYGDMILNSWGEIKILGLDELDYEPDGVIVSGYGSDGRLLGAQYIKYENGECIGNFFNMAVDYRMCAVPDNTGEGFTKVRVISVSDAQPYRPQDAPIPSPAATEIPAASNAPSASPTPAVTPAERYPAAYDKEIDAYYTFSVVKSVEWITDENNEAAYRVNVLRCGEEVPLIVPETVKIDVSSDYYSYLTGSDASALREGDLVYFARNSWDEIKNMAFIYRPVTENIITSSDNYGTSFERLFSTGGRVFASSSNQPGTYIHYGSSPGSGRYQYAFGAVMDKGTGYFTLFNRRGIADEAIEVETTKNTIVYVCDISKRVDKLSISTPAAILKSVVPREDYDGDGNVTFTDDGKYEYAFARIVDGIAAEVVIYTGYGE